MSESSEQKKKKKRSPLTKRQLASKVTATNLWVPDKQLFDEMVKKRRKTDAELLREIVHHWAVTTRLAPDTEEGAQEIALLNFQKKPKKVVEELGQHFPPFLKQLPK